MRELTVNLGARSYPVTVGCGLPTETLGCSAAVTDENVYRFYKSRVDAIAGGPERVAVVPAGEGSKSAGQLAELWSFFARLGLTRKSVIAAVGGGVVGDLAGFAAATYMRGVPFIQVPTTLLAQVDSSVGGKTGINLPEGKNLAGSFHQPRKVIADTAFLTTLPQREIRTGLGEVVKHAMLGNGRLTELLEHSDLTPHWEEIVYENIQTKAAVVEQDEQESGSRMFLNMGHTFAHAIETYTDYKQYNHGEAVAIGMVLAVQTGIRLGITAPDTQEQLLDLLKRHDMPFETDIPPREFLPLMQGDKKNSGKDIMLVLLKKPGEPLAYPIAPIELGRVFGL